MVPVKEREEQEAEIIRNTKAENANIPVKKRIAGDEDEKTNCAVLISQPKYTAIVARSLMIRA